MKDLFHQEHRLTLTQRPRIKIPAFFVLMLCLSITLFSCAAPEKRIVDLVWPLPPDEPKVRWVGWLRNEQDIREETGSEKFLKAVLGESDIGTSLGKPYGVHAAYGKVYVTDTGGGVVVVFDTVDKKVFNIGEEGMGALRKPIGITTDAEGNIYVADADQDRAVVYDKKGKFKSTFGGKKQFEQPVGVAVNDKLGRIYIVDAKKHNVQTFSKDGNFLFEFGKRGSDDGDFNFPTNIFMNNNNGELYITDSMNFRVQIFDSDGKFLSKFGSIGDSPGQFARPKGIAADSDGNIYVADAAFNNIQIFDRTGQLLLAFGEMGKGEGRFWLPAGIYIDGNDRIYVADQYNRRINIFQYLSEKFKKSSQGSVTTKEAGKP